MKKRLAGSCFTPSHIALLLTAGAIAIGAASCGDSGNGGHLFKSSSPKTPSQSGVGGTDPAGDSGGTDPGTEQGGSSGAITFGGYSSATGGRITGGSTGKTGGMPPGSTGGTSTASGGRATASGGVGTSTCGSTTNPAITGSNGYATRYWDCCKPSCSWTTAVPSCSQDGLTRITNRNATSGCDSGGSAFECYDLSPWYDAGTNMSYGFAAYNGASCGTCFQLQFTGGTNGGVAAGAAAIKGQQMIVQVINIGGLQSGQFDLLIPGGGVGQMTAGCTAQWGSVDLGATYGGLMSSCSGDVACTRTKCQSVFAGKSALLAGCAWFTDCFKGADNPTVIYKQVSCPSQITSKSGLSG
jgi:hypothetical protein